LPGLRADALLRSQKLHPERPARWFKEIVTLADVLRDGDRPDKVS
jgi:hypothetical protein